MNILESRIIAWINIYDTLYFMAYEPSCVGNIFPELDEGRGLNDTIMYLMDRDATYLGKLYNYTQMTLTQDLERQLYLIINADDTIGAKNFLDRLYGG